ncbi:hypothetical protein P4S95_26210 [Aneurinibacillus aneurinilyticus]|uniref:hypothetical protein n=1 Tax=Aneurinibacillus aneurinilyticus TaxID=1391 RepID=UPI002E1E5502|nr:hypothetical protein [Aneurinibacillus aneurinilyticus]
MNDLLKKTIDKYYRNNEISDYLIKCKENILIPTEIKAYAEDNNIEITNTNYGEIWPSSKITFDYEKYTKGEFEVNYSSTLLISKLAPVLYLQHEFQVENKDMNSTTPTLDGFDTQPYNRKQQELEELIKTIFSKSGYTILSFKEINEVIFGLDFNYGESLFGSQVTVEHAIFFDLLDLCPE